MDLIRIAIDRPVAVIAGVLIVVALGVVALFSIPIQLTPDVQKPVFVIETIWPGAAPAEVEREIIVQQEEHLKGLEGLTRMTSRSLNGRGEIELEFDINQDMNRALVLTANRLNRVPSYPQEVDEPTLDTSSSEDRPIAWFYTTRREGITRPIDEFGDIVEDVVKPRLERVPGISSVNYFGGSEREMRVTVDPERMARFQITIPEIVMALRQANASVSAGDIDEGKRRYVVRTEGDFENPEQVEQVVVRSIGGDQSGRIGRVTISDIGTVDFAYKEPRANIRRMGVPGIAVNAVRDRGANVIETMEELRAAVAELNTVTLPDLGLKMVQVYDETTYINSAIDLVQTNIWIGGTLAAIILLIFLRSGRATLVVALAIPVSVVGAFVAMASLGRSLNVISLAGLAFAVGMVVDAAIVVLENIYRLRQEGRPIREAAYRGTQQVWGAVLVSAMTTVLVFVPILIMKLEVGQLFRDIAVAISVAVVLSLIVSATVVPALANWLLRGFDPEKSTNIRLPGIDAFARWFSTTVVGITRKVIASRSQSIGLVSTVTLAAALATWALMPKLEYLPEGNRNLIFGFIIPPPGYNLETTTNIANRIEGAVAHLFVANAGDEPEGTDLPGIVHFFFVAFENQTFIGARSADNSRVKELIPIISRPAFEEPGTFGFVNQPSLFGRASSGTRRIELNISGTDLEANLGVAVRAVQHVQKILPREEGTQLRPRPGLELGAPEVRIVPDRLSLADNGVTATELGATIDAFNDGLRVTEITVDGDRIDLMVQGPDQGLTTTQSVGNLPVVTSSGVILPVQLLADVEVTVGPTEIRHLERERTVTLDIIPPPQVPLEQAVELIQESVIDLLTQEGIPPIVNLSISGTADELTKTWNEMVVDLILALVIVYLVMAILFDNFLYPFIIMFSVPVAAAGGIMGLGVLNFFVYQPMDMLTLLGFVVLIGIVVNNAILLVHQTLLHLREEGMAPLDAILTATRNRMRPIFMSTLTSIFGMLPLVVFPGAGSELYRGLGSVVVGGLSLSALLTLMIIPPLLSLFISLGEQASIRVRRENAPIQPEAA